MGASLTGCVAVNNEEDVKQTVAVVNISKNESFVKEFGSGYSSVVTDEVFLKRDMISSFVNGFYQYVQNYGYSYGDTFNMIKDSLVSNAVVTQYATAYLVKYKDENEADFSLAAYNAKEGEIEKYEYLLGGEEELAVRKAKYTLYSSLNTVLDSAEESVIKGNDDKYEGTETRSTPANIDSSEEDYVPEKYGVYTGYDGYLIADAGDDYEPLDGSDKNTRRKAYASFVSNLKSNYLITAEDTDTTDILKLSYVQDAYITQLQQSVVDEFNELFEEQQKKTLSGNDYGYVRERYLEMLDTQEKNYSTSSAFESAMDGMSDTSFILYSPSTKDDTRRDENNQSYGTFGYVYNILLPFSTVQNKKLTALQDYRDSDLISDSEYFYERNLLLKQIETTDQRSAWFNGETNYSFKASEAGVTEYFGKDSGRDYLFFENNVTNPDKYEALDKYIGSYSYNGTVRENTDGSYTLVPKKLGIDAMLEEFKAYIDYVLGVSSVSYAVNPDYYLYDDFRAVDGNTGDISDTEIDYSKLVYASGKVTFADGKTSKNDMFVKTTDRYKAMSAVNELQYAYTTDTGVLSQYIGYSVSAYDTSYIKEFEYAAQQALREGVGSFKVCAGDYGWHLIYVTDAFNFNGGAEYEWNNANIDIDDTFENRFYNWLLDSTLSNETTIKRAEILKEFNTEVAVTVYEDAYKDLSGIA